MNSPEKFRFFCQKVLPLVYDDSLSYYEVLCKVKNKINEMIDYVDELEDRSVARANAYTDSKIIEFQERADELEKNFNDKIKELNTDFDGFKESVNSDLSGFREELTKLEKYVDAEIVAMKEYTDTAIEENNDYIIAEVGRFISQIKVLNFFTGTEMSIQKMFDFLSQLHITGSINYNELRDRKITYTELANLNITYTDLLLHGKELLKI